MALPPYANNTKHALTINKIDICAKNDKYKPTLASVNKQAINNKHFVIPILSKTIPHTKRAIPLDKDIILITKAANPASIVKPSTSIGEQWLMITKPTPAKKTVIK